MTMNHTSEEFRQVIDDESAFQSPGFESQAHRLSRRAWLASAGVLLAPSVATLAPSVALAAGRRDIERYERAVSGSSTPAGAARGGVEAERGRVEAVVTDYAGYARFIEQFERARVVGRVKDATDLYLDIPILHGLTKIWAVVRFQPALRSANSTVIQGRMIKGNVKRLDVTWRIDRVEDKWTRLAAELLIDISLPAPESAVLKTVKRAAAQAVKGARQEAETRRG